MQTKQTAKNIVIEILEKSADARNSDTELYFQYLKKMGFHFTPAQEWIFHHLPFDFETIVRARRVVQNDEKQLEATPQVKKARLKKEVTTREQRLTRQYIFQPQSQSYTYRDVLQNK